MKRSRWIPAVFFVLFWVCGLLTAGSYGCTWDEGDEMDILRMNLWAYTRAVGGDESAFERRAEAYDADIALNRLTPISQSIEQDHGVCAFYPLAGVVMDESLSEADRSRLWHMGCWTVFTLGAVALYGVCRQLGLSRLWSLLGPLFLLLSPRLFAQAHVNNKDIALMALVLCVLWQGLRLMKKPAFGTGLLFALFGAMAANTKVAGLAVWGLCGLFVLIRQIRAKNLKGHTWAVAGVTIAAFAVCYAALTPALWADPAAFLTYLVRNSVAFRRWENTVLFRGTLFETAKNPLPWYYLPYMIAATTPVWLLALIAAGAVLAVRHLRGEEGLPLLLLLCAALLPLGFAIVTRTRVYNGWRHFYFVFGPMAALAAWGMERLSHLRPGRVLCWALALCMGAEAAGIAVNHPYQYAYQQPVVRLRGEGFNELDYWNISTRDALLRLAAEEEGVLTVRGADLWSSDGLRKALRILPRDIAARFVLSDDARFVVSNATYACFGQAPDGLTERIVLTSYGQPIMRIYEQTSEETL